MLWPGLMATFLGEPALVHASQTSAGWRRQLLPALRRQRYRRLRLRAGCLLGRQRHRPPLQCLPRWDDISNQLRRCVVSGCSHTQAFVLDLTLSPPYVQAKAGHYCWKHRPELWPS